MKKVFRDKVFRPWDTDQQWLLPPSVQDFVPPDHLAHLVRELVRSSLDLSAIFAQYDEERGAPPYHPGMMTALLLYAYCQGLYSSRRIARACEERVDFMAVTGLQKPDFRTVARFRQQHLDALGELFQQVLRLCQRAGLVKLGHVALDGTKVQANASKHKAMSYGRMKQAEQELAAQVQGWLEQAAATDSCEDEAYGAERRGDELPEWVGNKQRRLQKIREAKEALEAEAKAAEETRKSSDDDQDPPRRRRGRPPKTPPGVPRDSAQRNFTDPESRIMKTRNGFIQGYNAQAGVDASSQVIVASGLTNVANDQKQLEPMVEQIRENLGRYPTEASGDADFCSEANLGYLERHDIRGYVATGRQRTGATNATGSRNIKPGTRVASMALRLRRGGWNSRYRLRKQTVEPVFGQIKHGRGFRQFLLRGLRGVYGEWRLLCTAHNILKLAAALR